MALSKDMIKKISRLEILARKLSQGALMGAYRSAFRGQGMMFADFREYVPGDEIRSISWTLSARTGRTFIKKFEEERELSVISLVDTGPSMQLGSLGDSKAERACALSAVLSLVALKNSDVAGLMLYRDHVLKYISPRGGRSHIQRLIYDVYSSIKSAEEIEYGAASNLELPTRELVGLLKKRSLIFIISDFLQPFEGETLATLAKRHDVIALRVFDPIESDPPKEMGLTDIEDSCTGRLVSVDFSSPAFQRSYRENYKNMVMARRRQLQKYGIQVVDIDCHKDFVEPLKLCFQRRLRRNRV